MAYAPLSHASRFMVSLLIIGSTLLVAAPSRVEAAASTQRRRVIVSDRLVVRSRAGLHPTVRRALLTREGAQEIGSIDALGASVVRVPHKRAPALRRALRQSGFFKSIETDHVASTAEVPTDPQLSSEWGLFTIGAPEAWDVTYGSPSVIVAIVDSGIDTKHPDLRQQVVAGYDFVNNDSNAMDDNGHGTRMAGIVAAAASNGVGIVGVAPGCKLMPIKVLGRDGNGPYSTIARGITYAADRGARIISLSLAGAGYSDTLKSAVDYATARGAVVVAASGNTATGEPLYPAAYTNAVAVGATDENDAVASFSNYGAWLSLTAPGVNIVTTNWTGGGSPSYVGSSGTSPATAFTSGALALMLSANPRLPVATLTNQLTRSARDLGTPGWDPYAGWGRLDVAAAFGIHPALAPTPAPQPAPLVPSPAPAKSARDRKPPVATITSPANNATVSGNVAVDVTATDDVGVTGVDLMVDNAVIATDSAPPFAFLWDASQAAAGKHTLTARAYDAAGHQQVSRAVRVQLPQASASAKRIR